MNKTPRSAAFKKKVALDWGVKNLPKTADF